MTSKIKILFKKHKNFIMYGIIGCTGAALDYIIFYLLTSFAGVDNIVANVISVSAGITNNYLLNFFFNFKTKDNFLIRYLKFFATGLLGMAISSGILYIFANILGYNELYVKLVSIIIVTIVQYSINKKWSFAKSNKEENPDENN